MDESQADAIARAILEPDSKAREELRRKRESQDLDLAHRRRLAWFALAGAAIGTAIAYAAGVHFARGTLGGALAGILVGRLLATASRSRAP